MDHLHDMRTSHIRPSFFFGNGLLEFLKRDEPVRVEDQSKFVGAMPQNVGHELAQGDYLMSV